MHPLAVADLCDDLRDARAALELAKAAVGLEEWDLTLLYKNERELRDTARQERDALRTLLREVMARVTALETIHRAISERHDEELGVMDAQFPRACGCPDCLLIDASLGSSEHDALAARVAAALSPTAAA